MLGQIHTTLGLIKILFKFLVQIQLFGFCQSKQKLQTEPMEWYGQKINDFI
jgi:hypothetical protein